MSTSQTSVAKTIALQTVQEVDNFINALMALRDLQEWRNKITLTDFNDYDTGATGTASEILFGPDSDNDNLKHIDGAMLNKILGKILGPDSSEVDSAMNHLENTLVSGGPYNGQTYWAMIQLARRNKD